MVFDSPQAALAVPAELFAKVFVNDPKIDAKDILEHLVVKRAD